MKTVSDFISQRKAAKKAFDGRAVFDDGHGHQLRVLKTKRGVRLHIEDSPRQTNANIVLHPDAVAWLVGRIGRINGGKVAHRRASRSRI